MTMIFDWKLMMLYHILTMYSFFFSCGLYTRVCWAVRICIRTQVEKQRGNYCCQGYYEGGRIFYFCLTIAS